MLLLYRSVFSLLFPILDDMTSWSALQYCFIKLYLQCFGIESLYDDVSGIHVSVKNGM